MECPALHQYTLAEETGRVFFAHFYLSIQLLCKDYNTCCYPGRAQQQYRFDLFAYRGDILRYSDVGCSIPAATNGASTNTFVYRTQMSCF